MKRQLLSGAIAGILSLNIFSVALAGQWKQDNTGWWYDNGDGTYPANIWQWIDGNGDNVFECYYFDALGYCLSSSRTPDGYDVNGNGAWVRDGVVQIQEEKFQQETQVDIDSGIEWQMITVASCVYNSFDQYPYAEKAFPINIKMSDLTSQQRDDLIYGYQYNCMDPRFTEFSSDYNAYHVITEEDLVEVMTEFFGTASKADLDELKKEWFVQKVSRGMYYFSATGDFGDAGLFHLGGQYNGDTIPVISMDNGRLKIVGDVMERQGEGYHSTKKYTAYYVPHDGYSLGGYRFDQLIVE